VSLEVLTLGRVSVDLHPEQAGVRLADVRAFRKMLGASPTNIAVAVARLGRRSAVVTKVGADGFGEYVRSALAVFGVDPSVVGTQPSLRTPLAFCEIFPPDDVRVPPIEIEVLNGLGAGDACGGALCHGLLADWELEWVIRFANAAGALVASRLGCADDMPTADEVEALQCAA
jgi:sugar/nucleoside kinase (ribokinase family)